MHILGFTPNLVKNFVDTNGSKLKINNYLETDPVTGQFSLKSPKLIEAVKTYFKCDSVTKIPMEDNGGAGSRGSHFEATQFYNDIMAAFSKKDSIFSIFTASFFIDSGWYQIDISKIEPMYWGYKQGCEFFTKGCAGGNFREFCSVENAKNCTFDF